MTTVSKDLKIELLFGKAERDRWEGQYKLTIK